MGNYTRRLAVYYRIPPDTRISEIQVKDEIDTIKTMLRQCRLEPVHTFIDRGKKATMYKTMTDFTADPDNNISSFICLTAGSGFPELNNDETTPVSEASTADTKPNKFTGGGIPFGYAVDENSGTLILDETKAAVVRDIFTSRVAGSSYAKIASILNKQQIKSPRGGDWQKQGIAFLLKNRIYHLGEYHQEGAVIKVPCIINTEVFDKCQRV